MTYPDFCIIGAPKSGAATIAGWLSTHPGVHLPEEALTGHFYADDIAARLRDRQIHETLMTSGQGRLKGEFSSWYLYSDTAVPNITAANPDVKLIVCLRDPAEIAWALHSENICNQDEHVADFNTAWALSAARSIGRGIRGNADPQLMNYAGISKLGSQLARLMSRVPAENLLILFLEDIKSDPAGTWAQVQGFLDIALAPAAELPLESFLIERPMPSLQRPLIALQRLWLKIAPSDQRQLAFARRLCSINRKCGTLRPMPEEVRRKISDRLSEDIATLGVLTNRDLIHWLA